MITQCTSIVIGGPANQQIREILGRVGDKWSLYVIATLGDGEGSKRFSELKRRSNGISHRMLTVTLRGLERDGVVSRTVYAVVPPRVEYQLTDMGHTLLAAVGPILEWVGYHLDDIERARDTFDTAHGQAPSGDR